MEREIPAMAVLDFFLTHSKGDDVVITDAAPAKLVVGGKAGYTGRPSQVSVQRNDETGNLEQAVPTESRFWQYASRYLKDGSKSVRQWGNVSAADKEQTEHLSAFSFTAYYEYNQEEHAWSRNVTLMPVMVTPALDINFTLVFDEEDGSPSFEMNKEAAQQAMFVHHPFKLSDDSLRPNDDMVAAVRAYFERLYHTDDPVEQWRQYALYGNLHEKFAGTGRLGLPGRPMIPLKHQVPFWLVMPDVEEQVERDRLLTLIKTGKRDPHAGIGSSDFGFTDMEEQVFDADADVDDDGGVDSTADSFMPDVGDGDVDDGAFPREPVGHQWNPAGLTDEDIRAAGAWVPNLLDEVKRGDPSFVPSYVKLFLPGDNRAELKGTQLEALAGLRLMLQDDWPKKFMLITGPAGSGKTFLARALAYEIAEHYGLTDPVQACKIIAAAAPTGVAATNIGGRTTNSLFGLKEGNPTAQSTAAGYVHYDLSGGAAAGMCNVLKAVILDEVGMIGVGQFKAIDERMRSGGDPDKFFGGRILIGFGDNWQIPAVADTPPYLPHPGYPGYPTDKYGRSKTPVDDRGKKVNQGAALYHEMKHSMSIVLTSQHRQTDTTISDMFNRMKTGDNTEADIDMLSANCTVGGIGAPAFESVHNDPRTVHLFTTNAQVNEHNFHMVKHALGGADPDAIAANPIKLIRSVHAGAQCNLVKHVSSQSAGGIPAVFVYREGATVMMTRNVAVVGGIANGTDGILAGVAFSSTPRSDGLPNVVFVAFKSEMTSLPTFTRYVDGNGDDITYTGKGGQQHPYVIVPITPIMFNEWTRVTIRGKRIRKYQTSRTGYAIALGFAVTAWKCQGLTMESTAIHLSKDAKPGLDYVMNTRIAELRHMVIVELEQGLSYNRYRRIGYKDVRRDAARGTESGRRKKMIELKIRESEQLEKLSEGAGAIPELQQYAADIELNGP